MSATLVNFLQSPATLLPPQLYCCSFTGLSFTLAPLCHQLLTLPPGCYLCHHSVSFLLPREQFLKSNAQLTFRCRQLLSELSYIYPIDVVSLSYLDSAPQHISDRQLPRIIAWCNWWWCTICPDKFLLNGLSSFFCVNLLCLNWLFVKKNPKSKYFKWQ